MNTEQRLSQWLHEMTPEPPRPFSVENVIAGGAPGGRRPGRHWLPGLAAACVAVIAIGTAVAVGGHHDPRQRPVLPPATSSRSHGSSTSSSSYGTTSSAGPSIAAKRSVGPWGAVTVGGSAATAEPLAGTSASLYAVQGTQLLRLDPSSGALEASRTVPSGPPDQAVIAANLLWVAPTASANEEVTINGLDLATLAPVAQVKVASPGPVEGIAIDTNAGRNRLFVGAGATITVIDPVTHTIINHYPATVGPIVDIAVDPNDSRLYVSSNLPDSGGVRVAVLDPDSGSAVTAPTHYEGGTGLNGISASQAGIWLQTGLGTTDELTFHPADDLASTSGGNLATAGGGWQVTATVTGSAVLIGGTSNLACADPTTGTVRARATVSGRPQRADANITDLLPAGNRVFAYYQSDREPTSALVTMTPPPACKIGI